MTTVNFIVLLSCLVGAGVVGALMAYSYSRPQAVDVNEQNPDYIEAYLALDKEFPGVQYNENTSTD